MGAVMLPVLGLVLKIFALACSLVIEGSAEGTPGPLPKENISSSVAPTPASQPNGSSLHPLLAMPPHMPAQLPQTRKGPVASPWPSHPSVPLPHLSVPPPSIQDSVPVVPPTPPPGNPQRIERPFMPQAPASMASPSMNPPPNRQTTRPLVPGSMPPTSPEAKSPESDTTLSPIPPVTNVPAPRIMPQSPSPSHPAFPEEPPSIPPVTIMLAPRRMPQSPLPSRPVIPAEPPFIPPVAYMPVPRRMPQSPPPSRQVFPKESPSIPPVLVTSSPPGFPVSSPPSKLILPEEPPSSPPEQNVPSVLTPSSSINRKKAAMPIAAGPPSGTTSQHAPVSHSPKEAPKHKSVGRSNSASPPHPFSKSTPNTGFFPTASPPSTSIQRKHRSREHKITPAPSSHMAFPPASMKQGLAPYNPKSDPKTNPRQRAPTPSHPDNNDSLAPAPAPSSTSPFKQRKMPFIPPPKMSPSGYSRPRNPKMPLPPPLQALPPPPPHKDCAPLTCAEPYTYGLLESVCVCVLPIQVALQLSVALYTFFPLVSELAAELAAGVFMKQSQVHIMGANAAGENPAKTIVLIDMVPLGERFDGTSAYLTFQRFWHKQVVIKTSLFGDYDVLYVRYPGLPPSPPLPPSTIGIIGSKPYPGHDNNARTMHPLGVDVRGKKHNRGPSRSIVAIIVLSASVAVILLCVIAWVMLFKRRDNISQRDPTSPTMIGSLTKSSGVAASIVGSGPNSASFSLGSSIAAYTGSAKTFSSSDIERATDYFNETRVLGEGGFGRVYSGVLEDGTKVAVKILKRDDQQGGREFLAEVEMLSRLHHRNLVKLIGICIEDRSRCLVYELIPNGSVESHLHGIDRETVPLDWSARLKIALGAARALAYLHEDSSPRVIHRDFKASNILLEEDFTPKVSDFGLARTGLDEENRHISTRVMGTFGYVAPEYAMTGHLLVKSDVYSYGVVLLELLTGRKPVDMSQPPGQENLVSWARPLLTSREGLELIVDSSLGPDFPFDSIAKVAAIASMCVQPEVSHRPFMGEVVQALKLVCNECEETKELGSRSCSQENLSIDVDDAMIDANSDHLPDPLLTQSPISNYDYRLNVQRNLSMSELLSLPTNYGRQDSESFRRHSSSGPLRTGKAMELWQKMRRLSAGSVSEHRLLSRLWPGSH
ncbi:receptor-like serine threonine- kinase ALE2 isoform X1 [Olea europaea subsp. europaea]|uniref:Receptor-like serine threonine- kinase ALE2 isoform X1 n=1 Tax=Olea europaea subsp. europaea TaxID=158383 RepID=A0A8S0UWK9_OLEEU|nr:receptor-like serine threonine- kinase ALE2 isoform X1 [Olea europaea subsp. europaea]